MRRRGGVVRRQGHARAVALGARTADDPAAFDDGLPWTPVDGGAAPAIAPAAYPQHILTVTGDGWQYPTVDRVELDYVQ